MTDKERKVYIVNIALAILDLAHLPLLDKERIAYFADAIINLGEKSDAWIANNEQQFKDVLFEAKEINNRKGSKR